MLRIFIFCLVAFMLSSCASWENADEEQAELHLRLGTSLLQAGKYPQALTELLRAEQLAPSHPVVQNNLGLTYFARDRFDLAETHIRKAVALKKDYTDAKNNLGRVLIEQKKFAEADKYLHEALADLTFPNPEKPYLNLALSAFEQRKFKSAKDYLVKSLEFNRNNCFAQSLFGRSLYEMKDYAGAAPALDRAIGFCGNDQGDEPQYYSALAYYQLGDRRKAETRLEEILRIYPNGRYRDRARSLLETMRR